MKKTFTTNLFKVSIVAAILIVANSSFATIITVTNTSNDTIPGSLRQAAIAANSGDTIRFSPSLLTVNGDTITLSTEIDFGAKGIVIKGLYTATDTLFISGGGTSRIFSFEGAGKIVLDSVLLINGNGAGILYNGNGGAVITVNCSDTLHINNSIISRNTASLGGGVYSYSSTSPSLVVINNSTISENEASFDGGGVYAYVYSTISTSSVTVTNSTISWNKASSDGGGVFSYVTSSTSSTSSVAVTNSTISWNTASKGGGVYSRSSTSSSSNASISSSSITATNSTILGNKGTSSGGGLYSYSYSSLISPVSEPLSSVAVINSTISENEAPSGGGVYSASYISSVAVTNSTISGNKASSGPGGGVFSYSDFSSLSSVTVGSSIIDSSSIYNIAPITITSQGYNVFTDNPSGTIGTDQINKLPSEIKLASLGFYGGTTQTMPPLTGSIAIDMGEPTDLSNAQNTSIIGRRDAGAAEFYCPHTTATFSVIVSECNGYTLPSGDSTYTAIGTYTVNDTINNAAGCDSIMIIAITIKALDQSVTATNATLCASNTGTTITTSTNSGVNYYLRNDANNDTIVGPIAGTDSTLSFSTGNLSASTTYNVFGTTTVTDSSTVGALEFSVDADKKKVNLGTDLWTDNFVGKTQLTVEAWIKRSGNSTTQNIISNYQTGGNFQFLLRLDNTDKLIFYLNSAILVTSTTTIPSNTWTHIAATYDGANLKLYIDGNLDGTSASYTDTLLASTDTMMIAGGNAGNEYYEGSVADVRFWTIAKTQAEISAGLSSILNGNEANLVAYYNLTNVAGDSIVNAVNANANAYTGTLINTPLQVTGPKLKDTIVCEQQLSQTATVTVLEVIMTTIDTTLNFGESITFDGNSENTDGTYTATFKTADNCDSTVTLNLSVLPNGIHSSLAYELSVYPNPTEGDLTLTFENHQELLTVQLFSIEGQLISTKTVQNAKRVELFIDQPAGIYFLNVTDQNDNKAVLKIIKK